MHNHYRIGGGEDTVVKNEGELLHLHGHRVIFYTKSNSELKEKGLFSKIHILCQSLFSLSTWRQVRRLIKEENIDLVHVHNTLSVISPSVYYAAISRGVPVVQTIHNFRMVCPAALLYRNGETCEECLVHGLNRAVKHGCYRNSRLQTLTSALILKLHRMTGIYKRLNYICLTPFNREKLLEARERGKEIFPGNRIWVKPNFCPDLEKPWKEVQEALPPRKKQFIYIGRLEKEKGLDLILEAWKGIEDAGLLICGSGSLAEWCKSFIQENRMTKVKLLGQVEPGRLIPLLQESQALIFASRWYEGFPMTIVESFRCGTPVIVNRMGNAASLVESGVNGLVFETNSHKALREAVIHWKGGMYTEARRTYEKLYTAERNYEMLMEIYTAVLEK